MIDITITATRRPEILNQTLKSFTENLFFKHPFTPNSYRVIINVDPVGLNIPSEEVIKVVKDYFPHVKFRIAKDAHFPTAFMWCWEQVKKPFVFHLEEDWELLRPLQFIHMVDLMTANQNLVHLRLSNWRSEEKLKNWNKFLDWNGYYFEVPDDIKGTIGFCGHPSLNTNWFVNTCLHDLSSLKNPEKQIKWRNKALWRWMEDKKFGCFQGQHEPAAVKDIGRAWMIKNGWRKKGSKEFFQVWEKGKV